MATFRKRLGKWQVQVRRQGHAPLSRSFTYKSDAEAWARAQEVDIERGALTVDKHKLRSTTLGSLLKRYETEVSPTKKGCRSEVYRLRTMQNHVVANMTLDRLSTSELATYRSERLREVSASSVRRELVLLRHCLELARKEWGVGLVINPMANLSIPKEGRARERRVTPEELEHLASGLRMSRNPLLVNIINFAIATGMRRGEILSFTWGDVHIERRYVRLRDTKNGSPRSVPLSPMALNVLQRLPEGARGDQVFPMSPNALRLAWERLKRRSGIEDLRFHDLRHEAISRFFEAGLSVPEVSLISGHKDPRMLFRYTHMAAENVARRLENSRDDGVH
jgi:integrase